MKRKKVFDIINFLTLRPLKHWTENSRADETEIFQ